MDLSLEAIMNISVTTASKTAESVKEAPAVMTVVTAKEIELYGALTLSDVLDRLTSVFFLGTYLVPNNMVSMRGDVTPNYNSHILILMNGRPVRDSIYNGNNTAIYQSFPLARVDRLEVIRGPGSVLYGTSAYSGVINIITREPKKTQNDASLAYGSHGTVQGAVSTETKIGDLGVGASVQYTGIKGWDFTMNDEVVTAPPPTVPSESRTFQAGQQDIGAHLDLSYKKFKVQSYFGKAAQDAVGRLPVWGATLTNRKTDPTAFRNTNYRALVDLSYLAEFSNAWSSSWNVTYNHITNYLTRPEVAKGDLDLFYSNDLLLEWTHYVKPLDNVELVAGFLTNTQTGKQLVLDRNSNNTAFDYINNAENPDPYIGVPAYAQTWFAGYLQASVKPTSWLKLVGGGQANKVTNLSVDYVPRLGAILMPTDNWTAKVLYGQAFRSASGFERGANLPPIVFGTLGLKPEKIETVEGQLLFNSRNFEAAATVFRSKQDDRIDRAGSPPTYTNFGTLESFGLELESRAAISSAFSVTGSMTFQRSKNHLGAFDPYGMPKLMAKLGAAYAHPMGIKLGVYDSYFGGFGTLQANPAELNPEVKPFQYLTANLSIDVAKLSGFQSLDGLEWNTYGTNLLDADIFYPEYVRQRINSIPGRPGRSVYTGFAYRF